MGGLITTKLLRSTRHRILHSRFFKPSHGNILRERSVPEPATITTGRKKTGLQAIDSHFSVVDGEMSAYENVVGGRLRLKGKPLDVKTGGISKKKKKQHHYHDQRQPGSFMSSFLIG